MKYVLKLKNLKKKKQLFLIISLSFFLIGVSILYSTRFNSYIYFKRIRCNSAGATISANLYFPKENLEFQEKHPLIFFIHGLGSQKDLDPRIPIELTKRGFFVASIDYRGSGKSTGNLLDINHNNYRNRTNIPAIAQDCSRLLDMIESLPEYSQINSSQIGLVGHSFGGMVALMNGALDNRFIATVTWAGLVNFSANLFGISENNIFMDYIPAKIINTTNPQNLLLIHSIFDKTVPYEKNALVAQQLTNCELINITYDILGGPHYLLADEVLFKTINWFEIHFFNSISINGPIKLSYMMTYILLLITLLALFLTTIAIMISISKYFFDEKNTIVYSNTSEKRNRTNAIKQSIIILLSYIGFLLIWIFFFYHMGIYGLIYAPILFIVIYFIFIITKYFITNHEKKQISLSNIKYRLKIKIKSHFKRDVLLYPIISTLIFIVLYFSISISYPFAYFSPSNTLIFILTYTIYPFYLSIEIFYRKVVYKRLNFIKSSTKKVILTNIMGIVNIVILMILSYNLFLIVAFYASFFVFLAVMIINSIIYEKTNKFSSVLISSFIIIQIFFGSVVSALFGFGSLIRIL